MITPYKDPCEPTRIQWKKRWATLVSGVLLAYPSRTLKRRSSKDIQAQKRRQKQQKISRFLVAGVTLLQFFVESLGAFVWWFVQQFRASEVVFFLFRNLPCHGNPSPSFLEVTIHILRVYNLRFPWVLGSKGMNYYGFRVLCCRNPAH